MSAVTGYFQAQTEQGTIAGVGAFISYDNKTYQILGYSTSQAFSRYESVFGASIGSFNRLTDASALNVRPNRIAVVRTTQAMTLTEFNSRYPSQIQIDELAIINGFAGASAVIPSGSYVKRVVAG
jgi:predicted Zn-dependent protease